MKKRLSTYSARIRHCRSHRQRCDRIGIGRISFRIYPFTTGFKISFYPQETTINAVKRTLSARPYDFVVINAPLSDDSVSDLQWISRESKTPWHF
ncbi:MAG: hypothetical protein IJW55_00415 [Clostridia bacterium]|nr:hypothetical protein [Clostridia bacterium]